ncbi:receptor-interacting serine/threonine-protein kinase 2 isoform X2 [Xenopus tropicalis]|nr:receptor-interacting serine/threonine-protein kinase 2 isoform X2 [Xenopus tropicalis]|eukprot:XP_017952365.1 PREDICTED: receptor-interacting serine/threonine-protein kinase 2-like isoform X2 [Xenopus tropicalis]
MKERDLMHKANFTYVLRLLAIYESLNGGFCEYGLVMEYMPHGSLHTLFEKIPDVPWALRFRILHQVALGMNYLHHILDPPIIHRDLKPRNVLLNKMLDIQLTDFGLSKTLTSTSNYSSGGTLAYMPPESLDDINYKPTKAFDVYSFGILTWSVLSGQEPYSGVGSRMVVFRIPQGDRPSEKEVDKWAAEKMVPQAIKLMKECWDGRAEKRPSFSDCKQVTESMANEYIGQIDSAVEEVFSRLKDLTAQANQEPSFVDSSTVNMTSGTSADISIFRHMLKDTVDGPPPNVNSTRRTNFNAPQNSKEFIRKNFSTIVQGRPDISAVLPVLFSERIFNQEELSVIESSGTVENQTRRALLDIINKGQRSCVRFLELLAEHHPALVESLAPL